MCMWLLVLRCCLLVPCQKLLEIYSF
uniref:Uncharacterized protein n=1 Tax=Rhizophora mucronata TaxID=61149 RepID=A0A2P2QFK7_RHIMU